VSRSLPNVTTNGGAFPSCRVSLAGLLASGRIFKPDSEFCQSAFTTVELPVSVSYNLFEKLIYCGNPRCLKSLPCRIVRPEE